MHLNNLAVVALLLGLSACSLNGPNQGNPDAQQTSPAAISPATTPSTSQATDTIAPTMQADRLLTVCLINEPRSLFLYDALSTSEQSVLAAIYDGPIDTKDFIAMPVILEGIPSLENGDALLQPVQVNPGDLMVDAQGDLRNLEEGVLYRPSGCSRLDCAETYLGAEAVQMDQLSVRFRFLPGLQWSDGTPLTAGDSVYSYEVARSLYPSALPERVNRTASYKALDDTTVEWVGVPGFMDGLYQARLFSPLPQHAWASIPVEELSGNRASSRAPLGWGAYVIDEWVAGDHISLHANPLYFRASEGLPYFNNLVFRFVADSREAQSAVLAGECDLVDQAAGMEAQTDELLKLQVDGRISLVFQTAFAWDLLEFNLSPLTEDRPVYFGLPEVRQAVALCIDRQALVDQLSGGRMRVADLYLPPEHPLYHTGATHYAYDPQAASELLTAAGWLDQDNDPSTPRIAQGVAGVADGTSFTVQYLTSNDAERQTAAQLIQADLQQCGIQLELLVQPAEQYLAAGPDGPVFGRQFDLAQLAWMTAVEPPCYLYLTSEIPGPYPDYPKGWGGVNASGYSSAQYDQACLDALSSLVDMPQHTESHAQAQAIFAEDLPALPLYWHYRVVVGRPDLCGLPQEAVTESIFTDLELFNYGDECP
jgi:peptide/nickel transport system substrate-binding protein